MTRTSRQEHWDPKLAFLVDPSVYPGAVRAVSVIETHFAWVFLTGRDVYKLKKPLRQADMDYRTLASRRRGCEQEVRLNRRLAPNVYLAAVPLSSTNGTLTFGRGRRVEDWLVHMRQLPAARMLDQTLARRTLRNIELSRLVSMLVMFYSRARPAPLGAASYLRRLRRQISVNRLALNAPGAVLPRADIERTVEAQRRYLRVAAKSIDARGRCLVESHGDLRAEHVCLDPLCVIDCLEFSFDLRRLDPVEEIAFLSLEIERLRRASLASQLVASFLDARKDPVDDSIVQFYLSHRALTRAKLAVWHLGDPQFPNPRPWIARARSYLRSAHRHAQRALRGADA